MSEIHKLAQEFERARRKSAKLSELRMALPAGSSRARVTSLNAKWARAAEHRDRLERQLEKAIRLELRLDEPEIKRETK